MLDSRFYGVVDYLEGHLRTQGAIAGQWLARNYYEHEFSQRIGAKTISAPMRNEVDIPSRYADICIGRSNDICRTCATPCKETLGCQNALLLELKKVKKGSWIDIIRHNELAEKMPAGVPEGKDESSLWLPVATLFLVYDNIDGVKGEYRVDQIHIVPTARILDALRLTGSEYETLQRRKAIKLISEQYRSGDGRGNTAVHMQCRFVPGHEPITHRPTILIQSQSVTAAVFVWDGTKWDSQ